jgi:NTE family protein
MQELEPFSNQWKTLKSWFSRPKLGLVLGGGGARAGAHLGVLNVLHEIGYKPDIVVGTSMGALIAALAGTGMSITALRKVILEANLKDLVAIERTGTGLIGSERIAAFLQLHLGDRDLRDLHPKTALMATDLEGRHSVILEEGNAVQAVLASIAIPGLFSPVTWGDRILVDGGVLSNVPTEAAYQLGADRLIAIDVGGGDWTAELALDNVRTLNAQIQRALYWLLSLSKREKAFETWVRSAMLTGDALAHYQLQTHPPDILLRPHMPNIGLFSMEMLQQAINAGENCAKAMEPDIRQLLQQRYYVRKSPSRRQKIQSLPMTSA